MVLFTLSREGRHLGALTPPLLLKAALLGAWLGGRCHISLREHFLVQLWVGCLCAAAVRLSICVNKSGFWFFSLWMIWRMCLWPLLIRGTFLWEHPFCVQVVSTLLLAFLRNSKAIFMLPVIHKRGLSHSLRHVLAWKWNRSKWSYLEGNLMLVFRNSHYFPFKKNQPPNPTLFVSCMTGPNKASLAWGPGPKHSEAE